MRSRTGWRTAASLAGACSLLAGCGGTVSTGERLARLADDVAAKVSAGDGCEAGDAARRLQRAVIQAINRRELPPDRLEETLGDVNELAASLGCDLPLRARAAALARALAERFRLSRF